MAFSRQLQAFVVRFKAAQRAFWRQHPSHRNNGEENRYIFDTTDGTPQRRRGQRSFIANYTKGLPHDAEDGLIYDSRHFELFVRGINSGDLTNFVSTPLGPPPNGVSPGQSPNWASQFTGNVNVRAWESQAAGLVFDLEGPDAQAVTMPPAPTLESEELIAEVAEVYEMALLRDVPFANFEAELTAPLARLNQLAWFKGEPLPNVPPDAQSRRRGPLNIQTVFRGIAPGDGQGPYLSQFLCRGTPELGSDADGAVDGFVQYGALVFQNRVRSRPQRRIT